MSGLVADAAWLAALRARADQPPRQPRVPARPGLLEETAKGWRVNGELTNSLHELAIGMRGAGLAHAWRDEQLRYRCRMLTRRPSGESRPGYIVEYLDWYSCVIPEGLMPVNQDGEVSQFRLMRPEEVAHLNAA